MVKYEALGKDDTKQGVSHRTKQSAIQNERCLFAVAPFMLALIDLEKFRSFQKPN